MTIIKDEIAERFDKIERALQWLQDEMDALRDQVRRTTQAATQRADAAQTNAQAAKPS